MYQIPDFKGFAFQIPELQLDTESYNASFTSPKIK